MVKGGLSEHKALPWLLGMGRIALHALTAELAPTAIEFKIENEETGEEAWVTANGERQLWEKVRQNSRL